MRPSVRAHVATPIGARAIAVLAVLALLLVGLVSTGTARAADYRVNLRVLVVTNGSPSENAIATQLQREGVPYTLVDTRTAGRPTIDAAFLTAGGGTVAKYQAVVLPDQNGTGLAAAEVTALKIYERSYGVRQVSAYSYPGPSMGLQNDGANPPYSGPLDGGTITVTSAGLSGPFRYLKGTVPVDNFDTAVVEVPVYLAQPLSPLPAGETFTPLMTATVGSRSGVVAGVHAKDGREELVLTAAYNADQQWFNEIAHGLVSWMTRGINLGYNRAYFAAQIDDLFLPDGRWSVTGNCTPGDNCVDPATTTTDIRMTPDNVARLRAWQTANDFKLDMVFNAGGIDLYKTDNNVATDPLSEAFLAAKSEFPWMSHTLDHTYLGCIQIAPLVQGDPWTCATTPAEIDPEYARRQDPTVTPQESGGIYWAAQEYVRNQVAANQAWAATNNLPGFDPAELVTGEHSGLKALPNQTVDNPFFGPALAATGVQYTASDASREPAPRTVTGGSTVTVPRYPMNIFYNAGTYLDEVDEYNWIYTSKDVGGGGICTANPATSTCITPLPAGSAAEARASFDGYIKPIEVRNALKRVLTNDPRPFYAHQSNLAEDGILYPVLEGVLSQYRATHAGNAPILQTDLTTQNRTLVRMDAWRAASGGVDAYIDSTGVHVSGGSGQVPLTMPAGSTVTGASMDSYGGELSGWGTGSISATPSTPMGGYVGTATTAPPAPTITGAWAGVSSVTLGWNPPATDGGSPVTGYVVSVYEGDSTTATKTLTTDQFTTGLVVPDLVNGTPYTFTVAATNAVGTGLPSARSVSVTPKALPPGAPTGVTMVVGNGTVTVSWTPPAGATDISSYQVRAYPNGDPALLSTVSVPATATTAVLTGLPNGVWTGFTVVAENTGGFGPPSEWQTVLVHTVPDAPANLRAVAKDGQVDLSWDPPASDGGYPMDATGTFYRVTTYSGTDVVGTPVTTASSVRTATVGGLTNGTPYTFQVVAGNPAGAGVAASTTGTPQAPPTVPGAPTIQSVAPGDGQMTVVWAPPVDGGSAITAYDVQAYEGTTAAASPVRVAGTETSGVVTGLTNGTTYSVTVTAVNAQGAGLASAPWSPVVPEKATTPPGAPTDVVATAGDGTATVTWTAPASDGGSPVTGYVVTPSPSGTPVTVTGTSAELTGLTNGTPHTFTVAAVNGKGTGTPSAPSVPVTPTAAPKAPDAPTFTSVSRGDASVTLAWQAPASDGGSTITKYVVTVLEGDSTTGRTVDVGLVTSATIGELVNGTSYRFTVAAVNAQGTGAASAATDAVTPAAAPGAPTGVQATAGPGSATVTWTPPADGGSPITGYVVRAIPAGSGTTIEQSAPSASTSAGFTGLANGTAYTFTVAAISGAGTGPASAPSNSVTPVDAPGAPTGVTATAGNATATVAWTAPASDGGSAITAYRVSAFAGGSSTPVTVSVGDVRSADVPGLVNGTAYTFSVAAINGVNTGPESQQSAAVTPATTPAAPVIGTATAADSSATVSWTPTAGDGGSAITGYRISVFVGDATTPSTSVTVPGAATASAPVRGLTNGETYSFTVAAVNGVGAGAESARSDRVVPAAATSAPDTPVIGMATAGVGEATVRWTDSGTEATSYEVRAYAAGGGAPTVTPVDGPASSATVTGLFNGTAYEFTVVATNGAGPSGESPRSNSVTPRTAPGRPTIGTATAGAESATVSWTAPSDTGGADITGYEVRTFAEGATDPVVSGVPASPTTYVVTGLTAGVAYTFEVVAKNPAGPGLASARSNPVTPSAAPTAPGAPTAVTATAGDASATLTWTAPSADGGSEIKGYDVVTYQGSTPVTTTTVTVAGTTATVTGLANGAAYTFTVAARNAVGPGEPSAPSNEVTPSAAQTAPGIPTAVTATPGDASATLAWTAPSADGGSEIKGYDVVTYQGSTPVTTTTVTVAGTTATVTGLANGAAYTFTVAARNAVGPGEPSAPSNEVTPKTSATVPGAPTNVSATPGAGSASVTWTKPADGGSPITGYVVTAYDGNTPVAPAVTVEGADASTTTVGGLTNGTAYTFTVAAENGIGAGAASERSGAVTPATVPGAPAIGSATAGTQSATVTWTAPTDTGGSPVTGYEVRAFAEGASDPVITQLGGSPTSTVVTGLTAGVTYTFEVAAANTKGWGAASARSDAVTPTAAVTAPAAPAISGVTAGNRSVSVTWAAPADGGSPITGYVVSLYAGAGAQPVRTVTVGGAVITATMTGLTNGTAYSVTVAAKNAIGTGPASERSSTVTPATVPDAPRIGTAVAGEEWATVNWRAPASDGGSPVTGYVVRAYIGSGSQVQKTVTAGPTDTRVVVENLTHGVGYRFTVTAVNAVGAGPASARSNAVTPVSYADAPTIGTATSGNRSATVRWTAPQDDGGKPISGYVVRVFAGDGTQQLRSVSVGRSARQTTISNLVNGTSYRFTVAPVNSFGEGDQSAFSNTVTPATAPGAPALGAVTAGNGSATVNWRAPANTGGLPITGYVVSVYGRTGNQVLRTVTVGGSATSAAITGLTNGTAYRFSVAAVSEAGTGAQSARSARMMPRG